MRRPALLAVGLLVLASLATPAAASAQVSGQNCAFPVTLTDATGTEITLDERPDRVVTTNPSAAQTMWEIGGRDQVVGLSQYATYLEGAESRTNVSASFGVSAERVAGTNPDLVLAPNASASDVDALRNAGLKVYHLREAKTIADIAEKTTTIGRLTGNCEGAAETNTWMNANVDAVRSLTADIEDRPKVLYSLGGGYVAGGDTFIDTLFDVVGADNVAARDHSGYPQLSDEVVLQLNPEVLVVTERTAGLASEEPFASTRAGQTNTTVRVNVRDLNQPAPRSVVYVTRNLTRQLYFGPDAAVSATGTATPTGTTAGDGPGFTAVGALVAAVAAALLARRGQ
ncbi:PGF-CTERM-anchored ABC transporter substrate-binding protein [Haloarcula laminariae]|uniref:PGF-CTERM-anchored ABC transporter substrate-binding protein n=1 Tax=Haloarcula laminariae TaxID=2961577 RepID=UPI0021C8DB74|nr:PGF-CTERM-anchored ABC transporter substrate-binding protein [Halomicroarcula laminariae]